MNKMQSSYNFTLIDIFLYVLKLRIKDFLLIFLSFYFINAYLLIESRDEEKII